MLIIKLNADELISLTINWLQRDKRHHDYSQVPWWLCIFLKCVSILNNLLKASHVTLMSKLKKNWDIQSKSSRTVHVFTQQVIIVSLLCSMCLQLNVFGVLHTHTPICLLIIYDRMKMWFSMLTPEVQDFSTYSSHHTACVAYVRGAKITW